MSRFFRKGSKKTGLPPGSLIPHEEAGEKVGISLIVYDSTQVTENSKASLKDCQIKPGSPLVTWINIHGINDVQTVEAIGRQFNLHPLMLEDIVTKGQRAKLDDYKQSLFMVAPLLKYNQAKDQIEEEQVSIILGPNYVISFEEDPEDTFDPVRERIRKKNSRITQRGADYLCYALFDCIVDHAFEILEIIDNKLEKLEQKLLQKQIRGVMPEIQHVKHETLLLRKNAWPLREVA